MKREIILASSILAANPVKLYDIIKRSEDAGVDWIHVDVMDGHFVPNITFGPQIVEGIRRITKLPLDVHLMITYPQKYIRQFIDAGADFVTVHVEANHRVSSTLRIIRQLGAKPGVVLNPSTPVSRVKKYLPLVDVVLVMSVNPGFSYQSFIPGVLPKIKKISQWIKKDGRKVYLEVDGGINTTTAPLVVNAGVDVIVAGGAVYGGNSIKKAVERLRDAVKN